MSSGELRLERSVVAGLLLLCGLCCLLIVRATEAVDRSNERRRAQLRLLEQQVARPDLVGEGPIRELDGLFGLAVERRATPVGPAIVFVAGESERGS